jgi:hypothetical protein
MPLFQACEDLDEALLLIDYSTATGAKRAVEISGGTFQRARAADQDPGFSRLIREELPEGN